MLVASEQRGQRCWSSQNLLELLEEYPEVMTSGEKKLSRDDPVDLLTSPCCA